MITNTKIEPTSAPRASKDMSKQKILVIEDERSIVEVLTYNLTHEGFVVVSSTDGQDGLRKAQRELPDLIILDLMLPVTDGLQVCRQLRSDPKTQHIRVLMLTARSEEIDEIVGFNMGADDYVTKPFKMKPLIHRIKALLRRPASDSTNVDKVAVDGIEIDKLNHQCRIDGEEVMLSLGGYDGDKFLDSVEKYDATGAGSWVDATNMKLNESRSHFCTVYYKVNEIY